MEKLWEIDGESFIHRPTPDGWAFACEPNGDQLAVGRAATFSGDWPVDCPRCLALERATVPSGEGAG